MVTIILWTLTPESRPEPSVISIEQLIEQISCILYEIGTVIMVIMSCEGDFCALYSANT